MQEDSSVLSFTLGSSISGEKKKLSFLHILGIGCSQLAPSILFMVLPTFFQPLSTKLLIPQIWKTVLLFISSFSVFIASPMIGVYSDRCMFKWGRRRIFIVVSLAMILLGLFMMTYCIEIGKFLKPDNPKLLQQIIFGFSYEFVNIAGTILDTPSRSITADITPICQQNLMANICSIYNAFGGIVVSVIGGLGLEKYTSLNQEQFILILSIAICTTAILITVLVSNEEPLTIAPEKVQPFKQIFKSLRGMPKPVIHSLPSFLMIAVSNFQLAINFAHFIAHDIFHGDNTDPSQVDKMKLYDEGMSFAMICIAIRHGFQFIYGFILTKLCDCIGYKWSTFFGYVCMTVGLFLFLFVSNRYAYLAISILIAIGYHTASTTTFSITSISTTALGLDFGAYYGIIMMFSVAGEQVSNLGIGAGLEKLWPDNPRMLIGVSSSFGLMSVLLSLWVIEPITDSSAFQAPLLDNKV
ncbi:hypothetical protein M9Y10_024439 [Tritrichomonas musculus]|uniref:Major facilitator superfamily transporter n=1 Tax=Tritrichomonas musculus TaxID=1915356 RepID=A0ABR2HD31_9EUKA